MMLGMYRRLSLLSLLLWIHGCDGDFFLRHVSRLKPQIPRSNPAFRRTTRQQRRPNNKSIVDVSMLKAAAESIFSDAGFYYGLRPDMLSHQKAVEKQTLANKVDDAVDTLSSMREEIRALRKEMVSLRRRLGDDVENTESTEGGSSTTLLARRKRQREFDKTGAEIERWAEEILHGSKSKEEGWKEITGWNQFNTKGQTKCFVKWMRDSRGKGADANDENLYPCMRIYTTIDAPKEQVCAYLSEENRMGEYNDLVVKVGFAIIPSVALAQIVHLVFVSSVATWRKSVRTPRYVGGKVLRSCLSNRETL